MYYQDTSGRWETSIPNLPMYRPPPDPGYMKVITLGNINYGWCIKMQNKEERRISMTFVFNFANFSATIIGVLIW